MSTESRTITVNVAEELFDEVHDRLQDILAEEFDATEETPNTFEITADASDGDDGESDAA